MSSPARRIPERDKRIRGIFPGNYGGELWSTWNIDLERYPGSISLSNHLNSVSAASEGLGVIYKLLRTNATTVDQWFGFVYNADIVRNGNSSPTAGTWATDDTAGTFNDPRDAVIHELANGEQRVLCSRATNIALLNSSGAANVWDDDWFTAVAGGSTPTSLDFHPLARLQRLVAHGDKQSGVACINTIDKDDVVTMSRLVFGAEYSVRNIYPSSNRFWIGLQHDYDGNARIVEWDGFSLTYNNEYDLVGSYPLCGFIVRDVPHFITERGYIFRFTGSGFQKVSDFCLEEERMVFSTSVTSDATINNYGACVDGDIVYLNVGIPMRIESGSSLLQGVRKGRSGIWVFDTRNYNLYHHRGFGERVSAGTKSFGGGIIAQPGTVTLVPIGGIARLIASASVYVGGASWNTGAQSILYHDGTPTTTSLNRGYIITPFIPIGEIEAAWDAIWTKFKRFVNSNNRLVVKWRVREPLKQQDGIGTNNQYFSPLQAAGTWVSTTTFTCAVPTGVAVGDEVEVLSGDNAGCSFNISALSATPDGSTSITVTIDEAAPVSSTDTAAFRFDNWRSETAISATDIGSKRIPLTVSSTANSGNAKGEFIQLKIELRGLDMTLDEVIPTYKPLTTVDNS